ncbi:MAG TPA: hypothetical protein VF799_11110 [Geobacteraceae bacterium]
MKANTRISIAYVAGCLINRKAFSSVADHSDSTTVKMNGTFSCNNIDVQIDDGDSRIIGLSKENEVSFFHSVENSAIRMKIEGTNFKGNDGGTGKDFMGSVSGKAVKIYDYGSYQNFFFALGE